ncbi:hypothetical protein AMTR_s00019p00117340 [Amborella trichopoda]|uniref:Peroxidase n=2 Tax=Amborella trichopoda TaxID=13333 RepID=W1PJ38_AMBTC|nr:hypothetical protein AMTR_s00019p00117340 [Amborella trichopoda]
MLVTDAVRSASTFDQTVPAKLLRLLFHDCMVEGCDGSVLVEGNGTERADPANASLGGFQVVESAKALVEVFCPSTVSCADVLVLAARDAVRLGGGPNVRVLMGRKDGRVSSEANVRANIVDTTFDLDQMTKIFSSKALNLDDLVALSGAHTIGRSHCSAFSDRFAQDSKGKLTPTDPLLDKKYGNDLLSQCPRNADPSITVDNDPETGLVFDNVYYQNLVMGKGLFHSDSVLFGDTRTRNKVLRFAESEESFFEGWERSFLRLTSIGVKTGNQGEIRRLCREING